MSALCIICGKVLAGTEHRPGPIPKRTCSYYCRQEEKKILSREKTARQLWTCKGCGNKFNGRKQPFCTKECRIKFDRIKIVKHINCSYCGKMYGISQQTLRSQKRNQKHFCSKECNGGALYNQMQATIVKVVCESCGKEFTKRKSQHRVKWCLDCKVRRFKDRRHKIGVMYRIGRKGKNYGEEIDYYSICLRDRFRCQLCGIKTRPDYPPLHSLYPTVDHIMPISKGGRHEVANLQCACRQCNQRKGRKLIGQLRFA